MPKSNDYQNINQGKQSFDQIYNLPDPRAYYNKLGGLDYLIPSSAKPVLEAAISAFRIARGVRAPTVLDLGCSYGINGALLKYDLEVEDLVSRYSDPKMRNAAVAEIIADDIEYFDELDERAELEVIGLDVAAEAIGYGKATGVLDQGFAENLEEAPLSLEAAAIADCDIIASTGCIGYVTSRTFERLLEVRDQSEAPWVASFVLRMFPYDGIENTLQKFGLETEKLEGQYFLQRRFADREERDHAIGRLRALGVDPSGLETEGKYFAEFYLSRPPEEVAALPLKKMIGNGKAPRAKVVSPGIELPASP